MEQSPPSVSGVGVGMPCCQASVISARAWPATYRILNKAPLLLFRNIENRLGVLYLVIINVTLELTRAYADESARGFINGVLDKLAKELRQVEIK
ncbi:MAG: hypothetical protein K9M17_01915 [Mariprofundaceae bacterium]|nr:hypothetical protein [Mariprofundaceae bacterium]